MSKEIKMIGGFLVIIVVAFLVWYGVGRQKSTDQTRTEAGQQQEAGALTASVKVGVIVPLTGDAASYGETARNVFRIATDEINTAGGVKGRPLELIIEDGKCNGGDAAAAMQKLANVDGVAAVIGGFCPSESLAAVPIAEQKKIALFSAGSSNPELTGKSPYFMRNYPSDASQGAVLADVAVKRGWKKVAFMQEQLDYPLGIYKAFAIQFQRNKGAVVKEEFASTAADVRLSLKKLRAEKPDALFIDTQTSAASERVLKQVKELRWTIPLLFANSLLIDPKIIEVNKDALEGAIAAEFGVYPENSKFKALVETYKGRYGTDMPYQSYAQTEYDAVFMVRDALIAVGEDGEKISQWLRSTIGWEGASGAITIGGDGDRVGGYVSKVIKGGKAELLQE